MARGKARDASSRPRANIPSSPGFTTSGRAPAGPTISPNSTSGCPPTGRSPRRMSAWTAIEEELQQRFPATEILIHLDPGRPHRPRDPVAAGNHGESVVTGIPFFQVDAFAERPLTGNPAAVMPLDRWLARRRDAGHRRREQSRARPPSPSLRESDDADYELRWFTPAVEVPLCGHATLAAGHILIRGDKVRFSTKSGILTVSQARRPARARPAGGAELTEVDEPELVQRAGTEPAAGLARVTGLQRQRDCPGRK